MKLLKIKDNGGHFLNDKDEFISIDKITKEDLLRLADQTLSQNVEFDEYNKELLKNQAHQILYRNIYEKLKVLKGRKKEFLDETKRLFLQEYEKYRGEPSKLKSESDAVTDTT
ncbi:hypothetical protein JYU19_01330 [bacterium AH-315-J21]|nr:hypothetical protein [bacterium AH-315-J21]